jgi:hypothetical protein
VNRREDRSERRTGVGRRGFELGHTSSPKLNVIAHVHSCYCSYITPWRVQETDRHCRMGLSQQNMRRRLQHVRTLPEYKQPSIPFHPIPFHSIPFHFIPSFLSLLLPPSFRCIVFMHENRESPPPLRRVASFTIRRAGSQAHDVDEDEFMQLERALVRFTQSLALSAICSRWFSCSSFVSSTLASLHHVRGRCYHCFCSDWAF